MKVCLAYFYYFLFVTSSPAFALRFSHSSESAQDGSHQYLQNAQYRAVLIFATCVFILVLLSYVLHLRIHAAKLLLRFACPHTKKAKNRISALFMLSFVLKWDSKVKAVNGRAKSLRTLIQSEHYADIRFGVKLIDGNIGYSDNVYTFPYFCTFLLREILPKLGE